ncbi:MAG: hypothetical protein LBE33_05070 [Zoogloeaceae bacterium]|jgi:hypothetical protein|nr:hypothetical protein [Zoogloeaceae bacterium]
MKPWLMIGALSLVIIGVLVLVTLGSYAWSSYRRVDQLEQTINAVVGVRLHFGYAVEQQLIEDAGFDVGATWRIRLAAPVNQEDLLRIASEFAIADSADQEFYSAEFSRLFAKTLEGYVLYVAEMPLGSETICPTLPCNIKLLLRTGDRELFVNVWG